MREKKSVMEGEFAMEKKVSATSCDRDSKQRQELWVDGHKVVIHYGQQENPSAIKAIKNMLLTGIKTAQA